MLCGHVQLVIPGFLAVSNKLIRGQGQIVLRAVMLQKDFPNRNRAEIDGVIRVRDQLPGFL